MRVTDNALNMSGISKSYGAARVLEDVSLSVCAGTIHAVLGENGAGKSTLIEILAGNVLPDSGEIRVDGQSVRFSSARDAMHHGIAVVHQHLSLAPNVTVAENLLVSRMPGGRALIDRRAMNSMARTYLDQCGVRAGPDSITGELSPGIQQQIEIVRALCMNARVIALDEPTSSLSIAESRALFQQLRRLRDDGAAIILITHFLEDALQLADHITVLRDGTNAGFFHRGAATVDEIVKAMIGRPIDKVYPPRADPDKLALAPRVLQVTGLTSGTRVRDATLTVRRGEIVGLYGLVGAGRSDLLQALFGLRWRDRGEITVAGKTLPPGHTPIQAIRAGLALLPEDRTTEGLFEDRTVAENICVPRLDEFGGWLLDDKAANDEARACVDRFEIKGEASDRVAALSGGNKQKVLFARWFLTAPAVFLADEPTRGVDVGTKARIHAELRASAESGMGVLMVSSELPDVLGLSDRIYVMAEGQLVDEVDGLSADATRLLTSASQLAMTGRRELIHECEN
ncbi:MAG TPA: sugar ABC transporter ATP-binding protein [Anaerolineae bacterium]|nr:sugar ABC transporter ATP-binding protein [Anaerolineae bacterium]HPL27720.1 sugar ABC transporter ATP-binding protein [Anaerolineae bacterium]